MRKILLFILITAFLACLTGCSTQQVNLSEEYAIGDTGNNGFMTKDGYYFTKDSENEEGILLYYFDYDSGKTVPVCDKAECDHWAVNPASGKKVTCNAQICTYTDFVVYGNKIYYVDHEERKLCLRRRNTDGNQDEKVTVLDASELGGRMWFYGNHAFVMASTDVSQSFDPETRESEKSSMRLFAINLQNGKTEILAECSLTAATYYAFSIYQMENGQVYFRNLEEDKWYVYDTQNESLKEQTEISDHVLVGKCGEYADIYEMYAYETFDDASGCRSIMQLNWTTGEEKIIYKGKPGNQTGYMIFGMDCICITELNLNSSKIENMILYDMKTGELKQISPKFYEQEGMNLPVNGDTEGMIYPFLIQKEDSQEMLIEYRYSTWDSMIKGENIYQVIQ